MKNLIISIVVILLIGLGLYFFNKSSSHTTIEVETDKNKTTKINQENKQDSETQITEQEANGKSVIGKSVEGTEIKAYTYGNGETEILFIGGIHGGYGWNTALLAYEIIDYLETNTDIIPENVKVTIVPVLNPDGLNRVIGTSDSFELSTAQSSSVAIEEGRFNNNEVDLNRNFDCDWQNTGKWKNKNVSGGDEVFSEPESQTIKNYIETKKPQAVIVWYSAANGVFSSSCHNGVLDETKALTNVYAKASGYPAYEEFNFYEVTGDMVNWLAKENIPAISVLLSNHTDIEWDKNKAGVEAVINHYSN